MKLSHLTKSDKQVLLWRKAITLRDTIQSRLSWYLKHFPDRVLPLHQERIKRTVQNLTSDSDLIEMNLNPKTTILHSPVGELLNWVFEGLPPPAKAQHSPLDQALVDIMNEKGRLARGNVQRFLIAAETAYRCKLGWFMIFNTLTVKPGEYYKIFNKQSKEFKNYVRNFQRKIDAAEGLPTGNPGPAGRPINHTYCAVVEEGGNTGRLHIHVLHFCRTLPRGCTDPNFGRRVPSHRELDNLRRLWLAGTSTPIAVRTNDADAYGRQLGWRWPFDIKKNRPLRFRSNQAVAGYMAKYITKGYISAKRTKLLWRIRKTHHLGRPILHELLKNLSPNQLLNLSSIPPTLRLNNRKVPPVLLQTEALRLYRQARLSSTEPFASLLQVAKRVTPLPSLLRSSRDSTQTTLASSLQNIMTSSINGSSLEATSNDTRAAALAAALAVDLQYYPRSTYAYGTTSTIDT